MIRKWGLLATVAAMVVVAAACGSSSKKSSSGTGSTGSSGGQTITIGLLTDYTGVSASSHKTTPQGVEAGIARAAQEGYHIKYVLADTDSSPTGALAAAEDLVEEKHVQAVIAISTFTFGAASFLTSHHIPVVGVAEDGTEWIAATNMFSAYGAVNEADVSTVFGSFLKMEGVTNLGAVGYGISPSSAQAATNATLSAKQDGIKVGYLNNNFPIGSTNVTPVALAMKSAGINGFIATLEPNSALALIVALKQQGVNLKAAILPTGYGGDTLQAGPGALQNAQGVYFYFSFEPVEMHTAATTQFQKYLSDVGVTTEPTYGEYTAYASVGMIVEALQQAGSKQASSASLLTDLTNLKNFDAWGLFDGRSFAPADKASQSIGAPPCVFYAKLAGSKFLLVPGADPLCGTQIPGLKAPVPA